MKASDEPMIVATSVSFFAGLEPGFAHGHPEHTISAGCVAGSLAGAVAAGAWAAAEPLARARVRDAVLGRAGSSGALVSRGT